VRQSFLNFGGSASVVLLLSWQYLPLFLDAVNEWGFVADARSAFAESWLGPAIAAAIVILLAGGAVLGIVLAGSGTEVLPLATSRRYSPATAPN
jgi:hypothetical protein